MVLVRADGSVGHFTRGLRADPAAALPPGAATEVLVDGQVSGNGDCHHHGVVLSSMRSTHLTHQKPRRPGATRRSG